MYEDFDDYDEYYEPIKVETLEDVEKDLEESKKEKRKWTYKKGINTAKIAGLLASGYLVATAIVSGVNASFGHAPIIKDDVVREAYIKTEFDSDGNVDVSKQYEPYDDMNSTVTYYSGWTDVGNKYATITTTYDINGYTYEEVDGLLKIKDHPSSEPVESILFTEDITDKNSDTYYSGVVYEVDKNDCIVTPQTSKENNEDNALCFGIPAIPGAILGLVTYFCLKCSDYDKENCLDKYYEARYQLSRLKSRIKEDGSKVKTLKNTKKVS